ncbi:superoxide dismutase 2 [Holotrichia oblita]|nr:superoxide dismutase 2 [Holotrichia oblita]
MKKHSCAPGKHQLPPLPYSYDALEPIISARTLKIHHDHHHKAYVDGLNKAELALAEARKQKDFSLIKHWERELAFQGAGHILHSIYWTIMTPCHNEEEREPCPNTLKEIICSFGSFEGFILQFVNGASKVEASGWMLLVWNTAWGCLELLMGEKHQDLTQWGCIPVLVIDVWEHAYYLDYQYKRDNYVKKWLKLIDWNEVENRLLLAKKGRLPLTESNVC